jgi:hypothetical protein
LLKGSHHTPPLSRLATLQEPNGVFIHEKHEFPRMGSGFTGEFCFRSYSRLFEKLVAQKKIRAFVSVCFLVPRSPLAEILMFSNTGSQATR